jgi:hypothetical protein
LRRWIFIQLRRRQSSSGMAIPRVLSEMMRVTPLIIGWTHDRVVETTVADAGQSFYDGVG